ncbi:reverse transcriptase domain-containing protein [Tanacetum coccineum]
MSLELADRSIQYLRGITKNVLIKVDKFILLIDFIILDMPEDSRVPIILVRPFLATARAMIDRPPTKDDECYGIDDLDDTINAEAQELLANEEPDSILSRGLEKSIDQSDLEVFAQETLKSVEVERKHLYSASANEIDEKKPELKDLPHHLEYGYLHGDKSFPIIISSKLSEKEKILLLQVLEKQKGAIAWKMSNIKGISPSYCTYKILMEDDFKPVIQPQRLLNIKLQDDVRAFMWNEYYYFLDGFSGFFQIPIAPEDQEKTTFTCPYGTFAYRRMPYGLCNTPATFQRCMTTIFHDMVEDFMEVFMDEFSVFAIFGQRIDRKFKPIYYASKSLNNAQEYYTTTEKELLAVVFSFDKFRPYLVLSETIVYTDHSALKYLFSKQDAKPRLIRWVMLLQGFDIEIKDKREAKNLAADHLSRLENPDFGTFTEEKIADEFLDEHLIVLKTEVNNDEPWYADYVSYLVGKIVPSNWTPE